MARGQVKLEVKFDPQARVQQRLSITVFEARELVAASADKVDSKVTVEVVPDPTSTTRQFTKVKHPNEHALLNLF